jgi:hypothetical protein
MKRLTSSNGGAQSRSNRYAGHAFIAQRLKRNPRSIARRPSNNATQSPRDRYTGHAFHGGRLPSALTTSTTTSCAAIIGES